MWGLRRDGKAVAEEKVGLAGGRVGGGGLVHLYARWDVRESFEITLHHASMQDSFI